MTPNRPRPAHEQLRDPPESATKGARRGLWLRDGLFLASYALQGAAMLLFSLTLREWALLALALGLGLLVVRTFLKPAKTLWQRRLA